MDYKIPDDILDKIPEYFWPALGGELISAYSLSVLDKDPDTGLMSLDYIGSTMGWVAALRATCHKLDMKWLMDYWDKLEWYDSDIFDDLIIDMVKEKFFEAPSNPSYAYMRWLCGADEDDD